MRVCKNMPFMRFPRRKSRGSIKHIRVLQYELPGGLLGNIYILLLLLYYCKWIAFVVRLLSTTSITLIIGNFTFCLFSADLGQREESLKLYYLLLLDTFFPFKSEILNIAFKSVSGLFRNFFTRLSKTICTDYLYYYTRD